MAIDFNNIGSNQVQTDKSPKTRDRDQTDRTPSPSAPETSESVKLSATAQQLSRLTASIRDTSAIDQDKVESIRNAIADGQYHIDPNRLASSIVDLELDLLS